MSAENTLVTYAPMRGRRSPAPTPTNSATAKRGNTGKQPTPDLGPTYAPGLPRDLCPDPGPPCKGGRGVGHVWLVELASNEATSPAIEADGGGAAPSRFALGLELPIASATGAAALQAECFGAIPRACGSRTTSSRTTNTTLSAENKQVAHG